MIFAPRGRRLSAGGLRALVVVSALAFAGSAVLALLGSNGNKHAGRGGGDALSRKRCAFKEHSSREKRYVSIFTREYDGLRWMLPAIVTLRTIQDESCTRTEHRHLETAFWPDGRRTDFEHCRLSGNIIGDCVDKQGRPWRAKVFAKPTDEVPREHHYPESSLPEIRALLGEQ